MNATDLRKMYVGRVVGMVHRLVLLPLGGTNETGVVWLDVQTSPMSADEYRVIRAYLYSLLAPVGKKLRIMVPEWSDLVREDARDAELRIEDVYDVVAPRIVNWSPAITHGKLSPAYSKHPYAEMAFLGEGELMYVCLYLLRRSEVGGPPPDQAAA